MAEARDILRQKQILESASGKAAPAPPAGAPASPTARAGDIDMPIYPGAKRMNAGQGSGSLLGDGLSMALLETGDSVDAVIAFYAVRLKSPDRRLATTRTEEKLDGRRVVRLSAPLENGGLQTVEARDEGGKTTVELMRMAGKPGGVPPSIPGVPAAAAAPTGDLPTRPPGAPAAHDLTAPPSSGSAPVRPGTGRPHTAPPDLSQDLPPLPTPPARRP